MNCDVGGNGPEVGVDSLVPGCSEGGNAMRDR